MKAIRITNIKSIERLNPDEPFTLQRFLAELLLDPRFAGDLECMRLVLRLHDALKTLPSQGYVDLTADDYDRLCEIIQKPGTSYQPHYCRSIVHFADHVLAAGEPSDSE